MNEKETVVLGCDAKPNPGAAVCAVQPAAFSALSLTPFVASCSVHTSLKQPDWRITFTNDGHIEFHGFADMDEAAALFVRRVKQMWLESHENAADDERAKIVKWLREIKHPETGEGFSVYRAVATAIAMAEHHKVKS